MSFQPVPMVNIPDEERFTALIRRVFSSGRLTNNGAVVRELEARLADYLGVDFLVLTSSGTLALQVAYQSLGLTGEVITTPFSWITTASSLRWVGLQPRFVDIDPLTFNIDPDGIAAAITPRTSAVLAVHTFGNPADIASLEAIASRHGLPTIYDAAHAFGTQYRNHNVLSFGDASILSLHATKLFHTVEGGAVILRERKTYERARLAINNGLAPGGDVQTLGINGRLSELHAAIGLSLLEDIDEVLRTRRVAAERLRTTVSRNSSVQLQQLNIEGQANHGYFPLVFASRALRDRAIKALAAAGFISRTYFDTPLNQLPFLHDLSAMPVTESLTQRILCLPLRIGVSRQEIDLMASIVGTVCPLPAHCASMNAR